MSCIIVDGRSSPILGNPVMALARIIYGQRRWCFGHLQYGYGAPCKLAVHPLCMVTAHSPTFHTMNCVTSWFDVLIYIILSSRCISCKLFTVSNDHFLPWQRKHQQGRYCWWQHKSAQCYPALCIMRHLEEWQMESQSMLIECWHLELEHSSNMVFFYLCTAWEKKCARNITMKSTEWRKLMYCKVLCFVEPQM